MPVGIEKVFNLLGQLSHIIFLSVVSRIADPIQDLGFRYEGKRLTSPLRWK
ncbi:MAG: hypothetical protein QW100_00485 [Thermoplasmatales archaeon]